MSFWELEWRGNTPEWRGDAGHRRFREEHVLNREMVRKSGDLQGAGRSGAPRGEGHGDPSETSGQQ